MRRVGTVVGLPQNVVLVRGEDESLPEIGATLVDEQLDQVGRVVDHIGPVESPYVVLTPNSDRDVVSLLGSRLYDRS